MLKILEKLISFKTLSNDFEENEKALNWISEHVKNYPVFVEKFYSEKYPSLIISTTQSKKFRLILQAHLDVVGGGDNLFEATIKDGKMFGRGTYDMKFAIACYLEILKRMKDVLPDFDFAIMITTDEEIGGKNGVRALLENGYLADICFLPDGGKNWIYQEEAKGVWHLKFESIGVSGHGARPWEGKNAIEILIEFLRELRKEFSMEPCSDNEHYHSTMNIGKIEGGNEINKIPDRAIGYVDIRHIADESKERILQIVDNIRKNFPEIEMTEINSASAHVIEKDNKYLSIFYDIAEKYAADNSKERLSLKSHGTSDARYFSEKNIPSIVLRPKGGGLHSDEEWIDLNDLKIFCDVLEEFIKTVAEK